MANGVSRDVVQTRSILPLVYADALAILHGYEKIRGPLYLVGEAEKPRLENAPPEAGSVIPNTEPVPQKRKRKKPVTDDA